MYPLLANFLVSLAYANQFTWLARVSHWLGKRPAIVSDLLPGLKSALRLQA